MHSTPVRRMPRAPHAAWADARPPSPQAAPKRPRGRPRKHPLPPATPRGPAHSSVPNGSPLYAQDMRAGAVPGSDARFRTPEPSASYEASDTLSDTPRPKRKRGRPRKYPLDPNKEALRAAHKASAAMSPWRRVAGVERPPVYPETHVMFPVRHAPVPSLWGSPQKQHPAPRPSWMYYERPVRADLVGKRPDARAPEPLPTAPVGRRGRTRVDYAQLLHWQLACRARGEQLDPRALWEACVARWHKEHGEPVPSTEKERPAWEAGAGRGAEAAVCVPQPRAPEVPLAPNAQRAAAACREAGEEAHGGSPGGAGASP